MTCSLLVRRLRKILLVMTLKVLILLVAFGSVSAMGYSQEQKMDVVFHDEMLENVLEYLKTNTDYEFVYRRESLGNLKVKNVELKDVTLKQVLDQVLRQNGFDYEIVDKIVIVRKIALNQQKKEIKITGRLFGRISFSKCQRSERVQDREKNINHKIYSKLKMSTSNEVDIFNMNTIYFLLTVERLVIPNQDLSPYQHVSGLYQ